MKGLHGLERRLEQATWPTSPGGATITKAELQASLPTPKDFDHLQAIHALLDQQLHRGVQFGRGTAQFLEQVYFRGCTGLTPNLGVGEEGWKRLAQSLGIWRRWAGKDWSFRPIKRLEQALPPGVQPVIVALPALPGVLPDPDRYRYFLVSHEGIPNGLRPWNPQDLLRGKKGLLEGPPASAALVRLAADGKMSATPFALVPVAESLEGVLHAPRRPPLPKSPGSAKVASARLNQDPALFARFADLARRAVASTYPSGNPERHRVLVERVLATARVQLVDAQADITQGVALRLRLDRDHLFLGERLWIRDVVVAWNGSTATARVMSRDDAALIDAAWQRSLDHPEMLG